MKIIHIYKTYYPEDKGGVSETIRQLSNCGAEYGFHNEVFTFSKSPQPHLTFEGTKVRQMKTNLEVASTPFSLEALTKFASVVKDFDVINYHYPFPFGDLMKFTSLVSKPSIVTYHSDIVKQRMLRYAYYPLEQLFLKKVDRIVCTSESYLNTSINLQKFKHKTSVIPLGLNPIEPLEQVSEPTIRFLKNRNRPFMLFIGALRNYKGLKNLYEAAQQVDCDFVIIGGGKSFGVWQKYLIEHNMFNVHMLGAVNEVDKIAILKQCACLILPSSMRSEAFGLVLLEACMYSKAMISTELGTGTSFVNVNDETGLVIKANRTDQLVNACNFIINDPEAAKKMGQNARKRYEAKFTASIMSQNYAKLYRSVLARYKEKSQRKAD